MPIADLDRPIECLPIEHVDPLQRRLEYEIGELALCHRGRGAVDHPRPQQYLNDVHARPISAEPGEQAPRTWHLSELRLRLEGLVCAGINGDDLAIQRLTHDVDWQIVDG